MRRVLRGRAMDGGTVLVETHGVGPEDRNGPAIRVSPPGEVYARDEFVYQRFGDDGLRRLARIAGFSRVESLVDVEVDGHPRIMARLVAQNSLADAARTLAEVVEAEARAARLPELGSQEDLATRLANRDDGGVERGKDEGEFYRQIARRAKRVRERAAESLRRSRAFRKRPGDVGGQPAAAPKRRRFRRED